MALPKGLEETVKAFFKGCAAKKKDVDTLDIALRIVGELYQDFRDHEDEWEDARHQLKAVAGLSGRLAAAYAQLDGADKILWRHALMGLRDGKEECQIVLGVLAKHCTGAFNED